MEPRALPSKAPKISLDTAAWITPSSQPASDPPTTTKPPVTSCLPLPIFSTEPSSKIPSTTTSSSSASPPLSPSDSPPFPPCPFPVSDSTLCAALSPSTIPPSPYPLTRLPCSEDFSSFPAAILFQVASFLHPTDVNNLLCTCTRWRSMCRWGLQPLWREFVNRTFGRKYENYVAFTGDGDWRSLYLKIARFVSNLKRGHAEKRRFPRLLLPPISNTYEGCLAMTTDCTRLLWENGKALQCVDMDVGKELWRIDLEKYRKRPTATRTTKNSSFGPGSGRGAATNSQSSRSSTGRFSCCARASSVVIGRSMVFLHLEHQVHVYRLSDGTYVTTLCTPFEEEEESATFVGNNMPLDVSLRNEHFTFLTKTALFVYHSESLKLLYRIRHRELTPAMDTCEDIDFCWAGNRCCESVRSFGLATDSAILQSSSVSERTVVRSHHCDTIPNTPDPTAGIPFACSKLPDCVYAPDCFSRQDATLARSVPLCEANTFARRVNSDLDREKRRCEEEYTCNWSCEVSGAENAGAMPSGSSSTSTRSFSSEREHASPGQSATGLAERHMRCARCPAEVCGTTEPSSKPNTSASKSCPSPPAGKCNLASPANTLSDKQRSSVEARESLIQSDASSPEGKKPDRKNGHTSEISMHYRTADSCVVDCTEGNKHFLVDQAFPCLSPCTVTSDSLSYTQKQLWLQTLPSSAKRSCSNFPFCRYRPRDSAPLYPTYAFQCSGSTMSPTVASSTFHRGLHHSWITDMRKSIRSPTENQPFSCRAVVCGTPTNDERVGTQRHQNSDCSECCANKLSFRSRCQQSCRHIVTWLVKRSKTIKLWDIQDGASICTLHAHDAPIQKVRHVMNWKEISEYFLASLDIVGVVKVWGSGAGEFCCFQELRPEQNSCVFRMSFSPTHLATMSKESPASEVVVTVWRFDQEKAFTAMQHLQRQRVARNGVNYQIRGTEIISSNSSRLETSGTKSGSRSTYERKEDDRTEEVTQQRRTRVNLCSAEDLKTLAVNCDPHQIKDASRIGVDARSETSEHRHIEGPATVRYIRGVSAASLDKGKEGVFSHCSNSICTDVSLGGFAVQGLNKSVASSAPSLLLCTPSSQYSLLHKARVSPPKYDTSIPSSSNIYTLPPCICAAGTFHLTGAQRVYRSSIAGKAERGTLRRVFGKLAVPSLTHPPRHYLRNQIAVDPEDPSPYVNQAYLIDTRSTATLSGRTKTSVSSGSNNWARSSPRHVDTRSTWSSDRKNNSLEIENPSAEIFACGPLDVSEKPCSANLSPYDIVAQPCAGAVSAFANIARHRGKNGVRCSEATNSKTACRTGPFTFASTHTDLARLISLDSAAGSHGFRVALADTNTNDVHQLPQSLSERFSGSRTNFIPQHLPGSDKASRVHSLEKSTVRELQRLSSFGAVAAVSGRNGMNCEDVKIPVLEKEASFSAGVTAYYADFIDGQLLALWHFTLSPSNREHSAFQYSLSDWKVYDCLLKTESERKASCPDNVREQLRPHTGQLRRCRQRGAAGIGQEFWASTQPGALEAPETTSTGDLNTAVARQAKEVFKTPAFSMRNRGDVWTLLDWKCLSFETDGDVTVFDFCSPSAKELPKEEDT